MSKKLIQELTEKYRQKRSEFDVFLTAVVGFFQKTDVLNKGEPPPIHSVKWRLKDPDHLKDKLARKLKDGRKITATNCFQVITDLAGIRVIHLYQSQLAIIHKAIMQRVASGEWKLVEKPKAHTWDRESEQYFKNLGLRVEVKETLYTSIHYVVRAPADKDLCCEIQVRNLFEEAWGEIDHTINYPHPTSSVACREQLRVLAKVVGAGSRLAESIFKSLADHKTGKTKKAASSPVSTNRTKSKPKSSTGRKVTAARKSKVASKANGRVTQRKTIEKRAGKGKTRSSPQQNNRKQKVATKKTNSRN